MSPIMVDSGPPEPLEPWPTREEWAERRRTFHTSMVSSPSTDALGDYASPDEVAALIAELSAMARALYVQSKAADAAAASVLAILGPENSPGCIDRFRALSPEDSDLACRPGKLRRKRNAIRALIKTFQAGRLPQFRSGRIRANHRHEPLDLPCLHFLRDRRKAEWEAACAAERREVEATPVDDAAWAQELAQRAETERAHAEYAEHYSRRSPIAAPRQRL